MAQIESRQTPMNISPESQAACDRLRDDYGIKTVTDFCRVALDRGIPLSDLWAEVSPETQEALKAEVPA